MSESFRTGVFLSLSGGLLAAVPPEAAGAFERAFEARAGRPAARIGRVEAGEAGAIRFAE